DLLLDQGEERAVLLERALAAPLPEVEGLSPLLDLGRLDEGDVGFVDVPLTELRVGEVTVPDELVRQRPADPFEEEGPDRVLQDAAVPDPEDVVEVLAVRRPAPDQLVPALEPGVRAEAEVAEPARELGELLARHVRVALPAEVGRAEVFLTGQERDPGFTEDVHVRRLQPQSVISASREAPPPSE